MTPAQHFTKAPPRFNEGSMVKAMEEAGVGRPSTYAPIIKLLLDRGYVVKEVCVSWYVVYVLLFVSGWDGRRRMLPLSSCCWTGATL